MGKVWTAEEDRIVREMYRSPDYFGMSAASISILVAACLPGRTPDAVVTRWFQTIKPQAQCGCCTYCGKNEGDDIGPIVGGACADCTRNWS